MVRGREKVHDAEGSDRVAVIEAVSVGISEKVTESDAVADTDTVTVAVRGRDAEGEGLSPERETDAVKDMVAVAVGGGSIVAVRVLVPVTERDGDPLVRVVETVSETDAVPVRDTLWVAETEMELVRETLSDEVSVAVTVGVATAVAVAVSGRDGVSVHVFVMGGKRESVADSEIMVVCVAVWTTVRDAVMRAVTDALRAFVLVAVRV